MNQDKKVKGIKYTITKQRKGKKQHLIGFKHRNPNNQGLDNTILIHNQETNEIMGTIIMFYNGKISILEHRNNHKTTQIQL